MMRRKPLITTDLLHHTHTHFFITNAKYTNKTYFNIKNETNLHQLLFTSKINKYEYETYLNMNMRHTLFIDPFCVYKAILFVKLSQVFLLMKQLINSILILKGEKIWI